MVSNTPKKTGWFPDPYDVNDYTLRTRKINTLIRQIQITRTLADMVGVLDSFLQRPSGEGFEALATALFRRIRPDKQYEPLKEKAAQLKNDIDGILDGLISGVDLISALPEQSFEHSDQNIEQEIKPLPPPISFRLAKYLIQKKGLSFPGDEIYFCNIDDERLKLIRQFLHQEMPLGRHKEFSEIEKIVEDFIQKSPIDLPDPKISGTYIKIVPEEMYDLRLSKAEEEIRLPLSENLSDLLKSKEKDYYILPDIVDLSYWCSGIRQQGEINSCTSHAVASLVEYFQNRIAESTNPNFIPASVSARFLYKVTRRLGEHSKAHKQRLKDCLKNSDINDEDLENILEELNSITSDLSTKRDGVNNWVKSDRKEEFIDGLFDPGASLRQTLKALQLFGVPSEKYWKYSAEFPSFDEEPPQFCYAFAQNYQAVKYFRLDFLNVEKPGEQAESDSDVDMRDKRKLVLAQIKAVLAAGFPAVCGFPYNPNQENKSNGIIDVPDNIDKIKEQLKHGRQGSEEIVGHAVLVVGYNDSKETFLFQNSYGEDWGLSGYGWLPYEFVLEGLATDWWSLLNAEWVEAGSFGLDTRLGQKTKGNF